MIMWHPEFCRQLAGKGFYVIRFDNRDTGLSTKFDAAGMPDFEVLLAAKSEDGDLELPYSIEDMADDAIGLLDMLDIDKAHICGASMGDIIAQVMACRYPERVRSVVSMMAGMGDESAPPFSTEEITAALR
jgi:pimeloyl-ACP methyl ester carboxylesterase